MNSCMIPVRSICFSAAFALLALPASATWTLSSEGVPSGCTHVITDGNWKIGVSRKTDDAWYLNKESGNGSGYIAGEGVLDLRNVAEETQCEAFPNGVILKGANNGSMENAKDKMTECYLPDSFERMAGIFMKSDQTLAKIVFGSGIKQIGTRAFCDRMNACKALKTVEFAGGAPRLTESIGEEAFRSCSEIESDFDFSRSTFTEVGGLAFADLTKVRHIYLPETLTTIGAQAFFGNKNSRVLWFCGPPPTSIGTDALNPKGGNPWVLVAGRKHAVEWKADERILPFEGTEKATAKTAAESFGLAGFKPIGKWKYQTGGYTHWVVEEPTPGFSMVLR